MSPANPPETETKGDMQTHTNVHVDSTDVIETSESRHRLIGSVTVRRRGEGYLSVHVVDASDADRMAEAWSTLAGRLREGAKLPEPDDPPNPVAASLDSEQEAVAP